MATIRVQHVSVQYDEPPASRRLSDNDSPFRAVALDGVTLVIPDGKTVAVVGPSGCGKSTLLRAIAGLVDYEGLITYDGRDIRDIPPKERRIGMVFQNYALYPHFEGYGNLAFFFRLRKAPDAETEERIRETAKIMGVGFEQLLPRKPGTLSGGEQQRLAIGRALVRNPNFFLFDEPLSNLDAKLRSQTRVEIKRLLRRFNITAVYVTHDQVEAITLADRIAVMRAGRIEQVGAFDELIRYPLNTFVAGFLGLPPMNLLPGRLLDDGTLQLEIERVDVPIHIVERTRLGERLTLGVRPDCVEIVSEQCSEPGDLTVAGTVVNIEPDYPRRTQVIYFQHGSTTIAALHDLNPEILIGEPIQVRFPAERLTFFDADEHRLN